MAKDPYQYFRVEARELLDGLTQGILTLEKGDASRELIDRLMRFAHTLKGAARVVKQGEVAELAHAMEEILAPRRGAPGPVPGEQVTRLLALVDTCAERLKPVLAPPERAGVTGDAAAPPAETVESAANLRVEVAEVDAILYELADATTRLDRLEQDAAGLVRTEGTLDALLESLDRQPGADAARVLAAEARAALRGHGRSLRTGLDRARQDFDRARARVGELRLLPAQQLFAPLGRIARDTAESLGKRVAFEATGGEHRLDAHILLALRDALIQVVRNAVAHGIEDGRGRTTAGKSPEGRVQLRVFKRGGRVHFVTEDDGRGVDLAAIRRVVIARRLVAPAEAEALGMAAAVQLLFEGGFSTAPVVSEVMGRGVGLDVVRATVTSLKGDIDLRSEPGRGTTVELAVPVSLESLDVLAVTAGGWTGLVPFDAIRQTTRVKEADLVHSAAGTAMYFGGEAIPFRTLAEVVGGARPAEGAGTWTAVVLRARGGSAAVGVDRLDGVRNVVVRPLPVLCGQVPLIGGTTLDTAGEPQLVLDPVALGVAVRAHTGRATEPASLRPLPILVVDDSLTTRMLEQSILETAGYEVDLASSGEEGLEKARRNRYAAFVVDVEMPGMNGFELLEQFRADPQLRDTPAILVTSRVSPDDRRRGQLAGARAHLAKSDFDGGHLLRTIRELTGRAAP
jgi:two-component system chemotaxis sensor kinase CheA